MVGQLLCFLGSRPNTTIPNAKPSETGQAHPGGIAKKILPKPKFKLSINPSETILSLHEGRATYILYLAGIGGWRGDILLPTCAPPLHELSGGRLVCSVWPIILRLEIAICWYQVNGRLDITYLIAFETAVNQGNWIPSRSKVEFKGTYCLREMINWAVRKGQPFLFAVGLGGVRGMLFMADAAS